jgi:hypothetical protein
MPADMNRTVVTQKIVMVRKAIWVTAVLVAVRVGRGPEDQPISTVIPRVPPMTVKATTIRLVQRSRQ